MARSYRLRLGNGDLIIFSKETLFMSILEALKHRQAYITESSALLETICAKLIGLKSLIIDRDTLVETTASIIKHFDRSAYVRYISMHS